MSKLLTTPSTASVERRGASGKEKNASKEIRVGVSRQELRNSGTLIRLIGGDYTSDEEAWLSLANLGCSLMTVLRESESLHGFGQKDDYPLTMYSDYNAVLLETSVPELLSKAVLTFKERTSDFLDTQLDAKEAETLEKIWKSNFSHFLENRGLLEYLSLGKEKADYAVLLRMGNNLIRILLIEAIKVRTSLPTFEIRWKRYGKGFAGFVVDHATIRSLNTTEKLTRFLQILGKDF